MKSEHPDRLNDENEESIFSTNFHIKRFIPGFGGLLMEVRCLRKRPVRGAAISTV
jgi:hypothetical protein